MTAPEVPESPAARPCPQCGVEQTPNAKFCITCGAPMASPRPRPGAAGRRAGRSPDELERARGRREFARVKTITFAVRGIFLAYAFLAAVVGLLLLTLRGAVDDELQSLLTIVLLITASEVVVSLAGALWMLRAPLLWTTVAACYFTLATAVNFWASNYAFTLGLGIRLFGVVCMWCGVAQAGRLQRVMAADPSLSLRVQKVAPERRVEGGVVDQARARLRREGNARLVKRLQLLGAIVVGLVLFAFGLVWLMAPPTVDGAVARFEAAWSKNGSAGVLAQFDVPPAAFGEDLERRGWHDTRPALVTPVVEATEQRANVRWGTGDDAVEATFLLDDRTWRLRNLNLPALRVSDHAPAIEGFRRAWQAKGTDSLVALLRPASRDRVGATLVRLLTKREWHAQRPELGETFPPKAGSRGRLRVGFAVGSDQVDVSFEYWHPQWYVVGVSLP
jgi:hypothetical protein